jgi:sugar phosphate isomerase/epimerase
MKIGVGTFIVREDAKNDMRGTIEKLAAIGYDGVELLGFFGRTPECVQAILRANGVEALGDHVPLEAVIEESDRVIADHLLIGCRRITLSCPKERIRSEPFEKLAGDFARAANVLRDAGITPLYHNHDHDMLGEIPFAEQILDAVPALSFEPDVGWMIVAGKDPAHFLKKYQSRTPVIHLKDVLLTEGGFEFRPTGYGCANTPALLPAICACAPEYLMIDHDLAYDRDSYQDLKISYEYIRTLLRVAK